MTLRKLLRAHRRRDPPSSRRVYVWLQEGGRAAVQRARVLGELRKHARGLTRNELAHNLRLPVSTICGRLDELERSGEIYRASPRPSRITGILNQTFAAHGAWRQPARRLPPGPPEARQAVLEGWA